MSTSGLKKILSTFINDAGSNGDQDDSRDPQKITLNKKEAGGLESKNLNDNCAKKSSNVIILRKNLIENSI